MFVLIPMPTKPPMVDLLRASYSAQVFRETRKRPHCKSCRYRCLEQPMLDYVECVVCKRAMTHEGVYWRASPQKRPKDHEEPTT